MNRREQLQEAYEEALFALLMEDVIEDEGKRLLEENHRLQQDPSAAVSDKVNERCVKTIKKAFAKERRREAGKVTYRAFSKLSLVAMLCILLFATAFAASPQLRVATLNLLIEVSDVSTELSFTDGGAEQPHDHETDAPVGVYTFGGYTIPAAPEGLSLTAHSQTRRSLYIQYANDADNAISVKITAMSESSYAVDTEDAQTVEKIEFLGFQGILIEKNDNTQLVWGDTEQNVFVEILGIGFDQEEVLRFASGIQRLDMNQMPE